MHNHNTNFANSFMQENIDCINAMNQFIAHYNRKSFDGSVPKTRLT